VTQWASDYEAVSIRVATYNTGAWTQSEPIHEWANRGPVLCQLIRDHDFDIFGQQEGIYAMLSDMLGTEYGYIGSGNTAQLQGQRSAICYKKNKFEVLENGDYWNSSTPEVPGSSSSKCTWGKFREKASGREFYFFNSHFDVSSEANRNLAANLMLSRAKALAGDYPVFCTGDFNSFPTTEPIRILLAGNFLKSAYDASETPRYGSDGTYNDFNLSNPTARIDYIMVTKGIRIMTYGVLNDRPGGHYPSDHDPVVVDVKF
jgi:endonuclease/exonuclease/phosphatase family metal-dependent hydrolase